MQRHAVCKKPLAKKKIIFSEASKPGVSDLCKELVNMKELHPQNGHKSPILSQYSQYVKYLLFV